MSCCRASGTRVVPAPVGVFPFDIVFRNPLSVPVGGDGTPVSGTVRSPGVGSCCLLNVHGFWSLPFPAAPSSIFLGTGSPFGLCVRGRALSVSWVLPGEGCRHLFLGNGVAPWMWGWRCGWGRVGWRCLDNPHVTCWWGCLFSLVIHLDIRRECTFNIYASQYL